MADLVLVSADGSAILGEVLAEYKLVTGVDLRPGDPRRLHLQTIVNLLVQTRSLADFSGKQSLLDYVSSLFIEALASLWDEEPIAAEPSEVTIRFSPGSVVIPAGKRVSFGSFLWEVPETDLATSGPSHTDVVCVCTTTGVASNGVAIGQIVTLVDSIPGITGIVNIDESADGKDEESPDEFRERLRSIKEDEAVAGPRGAYASLALRASARVIDAAAVGPGDAGEMAGAAPGDGEIFVLIIEGTRNDDDSVATIIPSPSGTLVTTVTDYLSEDDRRPLGDSLTIKAPEFVTYDIDVTYYIPESRSQQVSEIQDAVEEAFEAYKIWQGSKIARDVNPSVLIARLVNAGARRVAVVSPTFAVLERDECADLRYETLTYGGIEDD